MPIVSIAKHPTDSDQSENRQPFSIQLIDIWVVLTSCFALFVMFGMYKDEWLFVCLGLLALSFTLYQLQTMLMPTRAASVEGLWKQ